MKPSKAHQAIKSAAKILIPSGRELSSCKEALKSEYGLDVPDFPDRLLSIELDGITFLKVKGKDIPKYIAAGYGDVGITGSDICEDRYSSYDSIRFEQIGESICTFELLIPEYSLEQINLRLANSSLEPVQIATHYPKLLQKYIGKTLNATIAAIKPSGCVEVAPALGIAEAVADTVASGETARQNNLARVPLEEVFPTVVCRK